MSSPPSVPPLRHARWIITDPDGFGGAVSGMNLKVDFRRRQERPSRVDQFQSAQWALDFGEANVRTLVSGTVLGGWGSMCLALGPGEAVWNGQDSAVGTAALLPPGAELGGSTAARFSWVTAAIPPEIWQRCQSIAGIADNPSRQLAVCQLPPEFQLHATRWLRQIRRRLEDSTDQPGAAAEALYDADTLTRNCFITLCELAAKRKTPRDSLLNRARLARRADAWMREQLAEHVQVPDVCLQLGVSRRELEYAFRTVFDQSPHDYLQTMRLNAIRRTLLKPGNRDQSVTQIAYDHGVMHLGRFAANYRTLFGERPSETLGKPRAM